MIWTKYRINANDIRRRRNNMKNYILFRIWFIFIHMLLCRNIKVYMQFWSLDVVHFFPVSFWILCDARALQTVINILSFDKIYWTTSFRNFFLIVFRIASNRPQCWKRCVVFNYLLQHDNLVSRQKHTDFRKERNGLRCPRERTACRTCMHSYR